jgi:hypothetical protein
MFFHLLAQIQPSHWFVAAMLVVIGAILYRSQRHAQGALGRRAPTSNREPVTQGPGPLQRGQWEVEMHDLARDFSARIDSKLALLEQLVRSAHHEALRLEAALAQASQLAGADYAAAAPVEFQPSTNQARRLEEQTHRVPQTPRAGAAAHITRPYREIYALADRGYDVQTIARQVPCPIGEVELILSLRQPVRAE